MPTISFCFPGGRYHATPWGSHVNEGAVEWPPSPWRLIRTFLATGFTKLQWSDPLPESGQMLIEQLASILPCYLLPEVSGGHSRHYMPIAKGRGETKTKIFDTFYRLAPKAQLLVHYPVSLNKEQKELFAQLVRNIGYLGRSESWVTAQVLETDAVPDATWCYPDQPPPPEGDQVSLIAPMTADDYLLWSKQSLQQAMERKQAESGKKLSKAQQRNLEKVYPDNLLTCLCTDTAILQRQGWSQPPGSRRVLYARPAGVTVQRPVLHLGTERPQQIDPTCILLALSGDNVSGSMRPLFHRCLPQAELIHSALLGRLRGVSCPALSGRNSNNKTPLRGHGHVHYIPLDLDSDGRIDHYLLHAPLGFDQAAREAIFSLRATYAKKISRIVVSCCGTGSLEDVAVQIRDRNDQIPGCLAQGRIWQSTTPFILPLYRKKKHREKYSPVNQVRQSLIERGFPLPETITEIQAPKTDFLRFIRQRKNKAKAPPSTAPYRFRIEFREPVSGPILLGYGSHFGLGLFSVVRETNNLP
jgi:CRISPR-associated protein Csb2